jgi:hypothetical protein
MDIEAPPLNSHGFEFKVAYAAAIRRHYREYDRRWPDPAFPAAAKKPENIGAKTAPRRRPGAKPPFVENT